MSSTKKRDSKKENMLITLVLWGVLACVAMVAMLYTASRKTIVISDTIPENTRLSETAEENASGGTTKLIFRESQGEERQICIPLEKGMKAEQVIMENRYMERELWIYLQSAERDFYDQNAVFGDIAPIQSGSCETRLGTLILKLCMDGIWEYRSTMENDTLVISYYEPDELYEQIVVVDPMGGGSEYGVSVGGTSEKTIALQVARQLQKRGEAHQTKLYYTRLEDINVSYEERLGLVEAVGADLYIGIRACEDKEHPEYYGIHGFYNGEYFIPEYGNVQWADIVTRNVTVAASNRAIGLTPAQEGSILYDIKIPAAEVCVGYMSNAEELALLELETYQDKLAKGLADAITEFAALQNTDSEVEK